MAAITSLVLAGISLILSVVQMIMVKKPKGPDMSGVEARKGYEMVVEGKPDNLAVVYGRAKVGGVRTYHATSAVFEYVASNANKSFVSGVQANLTGSITEKVFSPTANKKVTVLKTWTANVNDQLDIKLEGKRNEFLFFEQAICAGEINEIYDVIVDESKYLTDPSLGTYGNAGETRWEDSSKPRAAFRIDLHYATADAVSPAAPDLDPIPTGYGVANSIFTANFADRRTATFTGMSYAACVFRLDKDDPQFTQTPNLQFLVEGRKVRKISSGGQLLTERVYTNNPAYCLLDYLMDETFGGSVPVDEIDLNSFYQAAQVCDTVVFENAIAGGHIWKPVKPGRNGEDGNGKRNVRLYECNILIDTDKALRTNVEEILATMSDARLVWSRGQYRLLLQYTNNANDNLAVAATLTDEDLVLDQDVEITYPSASDRYNCCTIKFHNESNDFKQDAVNWPHKIPDTTLRGFGGIKYPLADFTWKDEGTGRRLLNKYSVWNGTINQMNQTNGLGLVYHLIVNPHNDGDDWTLECAGSDYIEVRIYAVNEVTGFKEMLPGFPKTAAFAEGAAKVENVHLPSWRWSGPNLDIKENNGRYYRIEIDGANVESEKGVAAVIYNDTRILWSTREIAYQGVQRLDYTDEIYLQMKEEDNGLELELETSFAGIVDYYHALSKAEELVKTSRTAYTIKFKYIIRNKYLEPGDYIIIDSETLNIRSLASNVPIGDRHTYFRINSVKISESNTCEVVAQRFHWTQLAWTNKDGEYIRAPNIYSTIIAAPTEIALFRDAYSQSTSGTLRWSGANEPDFLSYIVYMYEGGSVPGTGTPEFHEIGRSTVNEFQLPKLNVSSAIFAVRTQTRTGFSNYGYTSTTEAEVFDTDTYGFSGLVFSNVANQLSWTAFSFYKNGTKVIDISSGSYTTTANPTDTLYIYFDTTLRFSYDINSFRNKYLLGTYVFGSIVKRRDILVYTPSFINILGRTDTTFNTRDAEIVWSNNAEEPIQPSQYLVQILDTSNVFKKSYIVTTSSFKFTHDMNKELFVAASRIFKVRVYSIDALGNTTQGYIEATVENAAPSVTQFSVSPSFRTALAKATLVSDSDITKYVFKKYSQAVGGTPVIVETLNNYANIEATEGVDYWYTVTVHDEYGAGPESERVTTQSVSFSGSLNTGSIFIYKRSPQPPPMPSANVTYRFSSKAVTGLNNGWDTTEPAGIDPLYMSMASALSSELTDTILPTEWSIPIKYETNTANYRSSIVYAYQRSATILTTNPGDVTYEFTSNAITTASLSNGWLKAIPSGRDPLYIITAIASSQTNTDDILANEWSTPVILAQDGAKGESGLNSAVFGINNASSTFNKNAAGILSPATGIVLTTSYQNITGTITYQWQKNGTNISGAISSSYTVPTTDYASVTTNAYKCIITGTINGVSGSLNDVITIPLLLDGSSSPVVVLSNDNITIAAPNTGYAGMVFSSASCNVQAYIGTLALNYNASGGANSFKVSITTSGVTVATPINAAISAPTAMSADTAYADVTVTMYDASNVALTPIIKRITYSVSRTGSIGLSGDAVDIIFIRSAAQPPKLDASASVPTNWYSDITLVPASANPLWSSIGIRSTGSTTYEWGTASRIEGASVAEVTVYTRGVPTTTPTGGSYTFGAASPLTTVPTSAGATWSASIPAGTAPVYTSRAVANTAAGNTSPVAITGWSTPVISLQNGIDATFADLVSESDITAADSEGKGYSLPPSNRLRLYAGGTIIPANVTYSGGGEQNGLTATIDPNTGIITWTSIDWITDTAVFTFTARYNNVDYPTIYTYAKSKKGSPSVLLDLISEADVVSANSSGIVTTFPSGNQALLYEGGVLVPTNKIVFAASAIPQNGLKLAIDPNGYITLTQTTWTSDSESFTITAAYNGVTYKSFYSIAKSKNGVKGNDAIFADLFSDSDITPSDSDGKNYSLPPANRLLIYIGGIPQNWDVTYSASAAQTDLTATIDQNTGVITFNGANWTGDLATFVFSAVYNNVTYQKTYTYAKSKKGLSTVLVDLVGDTNIIPANNLGNVGTLPSGSAIIVYEAGAIVTNPLAGAPVISYSGGATKNGLKLSINPYGVISLQQPTTNSWSSDSESFTILTTYKGLVYTNIYTLSKAKAGIQGISTFLASVYYNGVPTRTPTGGSFDFSNNLLTLPTPAGWQSTPFPSTTAGVYISTQLFTSVNGGISVAWSTPVLYTKNGNQGKSVYTATVYLGPQANKPDAPNGGSYNFENNTLSPPISPNTWSISQPTATTNPTWACDFTFTATDTSAVALAGTWTNVRAIAKNGTDGVGISVKGDPGKTAVRVFAWNNNASVSPTTPSGNITTVLPTIPIINVWYISPMASLIGGQFQWQCDGLYDPVALTTTWSTPYLTVFKVDTLEAFTVKTGKLLSKTLASGGQTICLNTIPDLTIETNEVRGYNGVSLVTGMGDGGALSQMSVAESASTTYRLKRETLFYANAKNTLNANKRFIVNYQAFAPPAGFSGAFEQKAGFTFFRGATGCADVSVDIGYGLRKNSAVGNPEVLLGAHILAGREQSVDASSKGKTRTLLSADFTGIATTDILGNFIPQGAFSGQLSTYDTEMPLHNNRFAAYFESYNDGTDAAYSPDAAPRKVMLCDSTYAMRAYGNIKVTGQIIATGNVTAYYSSDIRLKDIISKIENPIEKLNKISGYNYKWKDEYYDTQEKSLVKEYDVGVIAQEIIEVLPEAVHERADGTLAVAYEKLIPLLIEAIKDQQRQIEELKHAITS
jgi:hypothetical protein